MKKKEIVIMVIAMSLVWIGLPGVFTVYYFLKHQPDRRDMAQVSTVEASGEVTTSHPLENSGGLYRHEVYVKFGGSDGNTILAVAARQHLVGETVHVFSVGDGGKGYYILDPAPDSTINWP